jgi:hypothetical protein
MSQCHVAKLHLRRSAFFNRPWVLMADILNIPRNILTIAYCRFAANELQIKDQNTRNVVILLRSTVYISNTIHFGGVKTVHLHWGTWRRRKYQ